MFRPNRYRRFTPDERDLVAALVPVGAEALETQLGVARFAQLWFPGSPSFDIHVPEAVPLHPHGAPTPGEAGVVVAARDVHRGGSAHDEASRIGALLLWVREGRLAAVEYVWEGERMPSALPGVAQLGAPA